MTDNPSALRAPVQVLVVGFEEPTFSGEVLAELGRLEQAGVVRLVDLLVVSRPDENTLDTLDITDLDLDSGATFAAVAGDVAAALLGRSEDDGDTAVEVDAEVDEATWSLADAVPVGQVAAVALVEHLWAIPLRAAMQANGARPLDETWLGPADLDRLDQILAGRAT